MQGFERVKEITDRRAGRGRPLLSARPGAAADAGDGHCRRGACTAGGCRSTPPPAGQAARPPIATIAAFDAEFRSSFGYNQPATPLSRHGRDRRGHGRYGFEVRRAPRDSALHPRELHAMHGVHLGLPRHRAAQHLAGSGARCSRTAVIALRRRCRRAHEDDDEASGNREADPPAHASPR